MKDIIFSQLIESEPEKTIRLHAAEFTPMQIGICCQHWPDLMLEWTADLLNEEQFAYCCIRVPRKAIDQFGNRLDPGLLDECVEACPEGGLRRVLARLSDRQFDRCVSAYPQGALSSRDAILRLTRKQYAYCVQVCPAEALEWTPWLLTKKQIEYCVERCFDKALDLVPNLLSPAQLRYCSSKDPRTTIEKAGHWIPRDLIADLYQYYPMLMLRCVRGRLSGPQRRYCISTDPWKILVNEPDVLQDDEIDALVSDFRLEVRELIKSNPWHYLVTLLAYRLRELDKETKSVVSWAIEFQR